MPPKKRHYSTVTIGKKLSYLLTVPLVNDMTSTDKLTTLELNGLVVQELSDVCDNGWHNLGHLIPTIFESFNATELIPPVNQLLVPLSKIKYRDERINKLFCDNAEEELVPLWDAKVKKWNCKLPEASSDSYTASGRANKDGKRKTVLGLDWEEESRATAEELFSAFFNVLTVALAREARLSAMRSSSNRVWNGGHSTKQIKGVKISRKPNIIMAEDPANSEWAHIKVVAELTTSRFKLSGRLAKTLDTKAYLILRYQPWRRFALMLSISNNCRELRVHVYDHSGSTISPHFHIESQKDLFLYIFSAIVFGKDECIGFDPTMIIRELKIPPPSNHLSPLSPLSSFSSLSSEEARHDVKTASGQLPTKDPLPTIAGTTPTLLVETCDSPSQEPLGNIHVNDNKYDILKVIFSSTGLIGRGTVCYRARRASDGQEFVIKDHWVLGDVDDADVLNEIAMMKAMEGIPGVPKLEEYCKVALSSGEVDNTRRYRCSQLASSKGTWRTHVRLVMKPQGRCLQEFRTRKEFIRAMRDIVSIQKKAVQDRGILHRDCSLYNTMIEDKDDGSSNGMLIDWEFAVRILPDDHYPLGGTGTVPFLSRSILGQLAVWDKYSRNSRHFKEASDSQAISVGSIKQDFTDDLESLFYVFMWICIMFSGPLGMKRKVTLEEDWLPYEWSRVSLRLCQNAKGMYFLNISDLLQQFDPYFAPLLPLARDWTDLLRYNFPSTTAEGKITEHKPVTFDNVIELLEKHLALLPDDELSPERLFRQMVTNKNIQDVADRADIIKNMCNSGAAISSSTARKKCWSK
ncbi:hypothetical protein F4604DRAFT_1949197 [Suillus subluteus]|nr:hypothetical protein F4604DRAFT_1949197 [Suillus subluteus]